MLSVPFPDPRHISFCQVTLLEIPRPSPTPSSSHSTPTALPEVRFDALTRLDPLSPSVTSVHSSSHRRPDGPLPTLVVSLFRPGLPRPGWSVPTGGEGLQVPTEADGDPPSPVEGEEPDQPLYCPSPVLQRSSSRPHSTDRGLGDGARHVPQGHLYLRSPVLRPGEPGFTLSGSQDPTNPRDPRTSQDDWCVGVKGPGVFWSHTR